VWALGAGLAPRRQRCIGSITHTHRVDSVFQRAPMSPLAKPPAPCPFALMETLYVPRSPLTPTATGCGSNRMECLQPLLSITVRPSSLSSQMHPDLCVASSIPLVSSGVNCQKISPTTHTYAPVLRMLHLWFIPSEVVMFADETNQPNVDWDYGQPMTRLTS